MPRRPLAACRSSRGPYSGPHDRINRTVRSKRAPHGTPILPIAFTHARTYLRLGVNTLEKKLAPLVAKGLSAVLLFGVVDCEKVGAPSRASATPFLTLSQASRVRRAAL